MQPNLTSAEQTKWKKDGWTPEAAAIGTADDLMKSLGVPRGRALTIIAQCKAGDKVEEKDDVEKAIGGDTSAQRLINVRCKGYNWTVMRNGQPDLAETRLLVAEQVKEAAERTLFHGLPVVAVEGLEKARSKLARCPLTSAVLDDHQGKLVDGRSGADWSPLWPQRGNDRALWVLHARRNDPGLLPPYAMTDPARVVKELRSMRVPPQWSQVMELWNRATPTQKAAAEEGLFSPFSQPVAPAPAPSGTTSITQAPQEQAEDGRPMIFVLHHSSDRARVDSLRTMCSSLPARMVAASDCPAGTDLTSWTARQIAEADYVLLVVSGLMLADTVGTISCLSYAKASGKLILPFIARACMWREFDLLHGLQPLGIKSKDLSDDYVAAQQLRDLLGRRIPRPAPGFERSHPCVANGSPSGDCPGFQGPCARAGELGHCGLLIPLREHAPGGSLRSQLMKMNDSEFDAVCLDHFIDVHRRFAGGMDKVSKINLLLSLKNRDLVAATFGLSA